LKSGAPVATFAPVATVAPPVKVPIFAFFSPVY